MNERVPNLDPGYLVAKLAPIIFNKPAFNQEDLGKFSDGQTGHEKENKMWELGLTGAYGASRVVDSLMTNSALRSGRAKETVPHNKWLYEKAGLPGFLASDALMTAGSYGLSRLLDQNVAPWAGILLPIIGLLTQGLTINHNLGVMKKWR
jgi:hypothetical protein